MTARLRALRRLTKVYDALEQMRKIELELSYSGLRQAERAIATQLEAARSAMLDGRGALVEGDLLGWVTSAKRFEVAVANAATLQEVRAVRELASEEARTEYMKSRSQSGQMKLVRDAVDDAAHVVDQRRSQASADDRYLARSQWIQRAERGS